MQYAVCHKKIEMPIANMLMNVFIRKSKGGKHSSSSYISDELITNLTC